jgi:hypothetical protein
MFLALAGCSARQPVPEATPLARPAGQPSPAAKPADPLTAAIAPAGHPTLASDAAQASRDAEVAIAAAPAAPSLDDAQPAQPPPLAADECPPADHAFCTAALKLAGDHAANVVQWGTARLDGTPQRYRYAIMVPEQLGRAAYLIEQTSERAWIVWFNADGRTQPGGSYNYNPRPGWDADKNPTEISHLQGYHHAAEWVAIAVRKNDLVVLDYHSVDHDYTQGNIEEVFAHKGKCSKPCPLLAGYSRTSQLLTVEGPNPLASLIGE